MQSHSARSFFGVFLRGSCFITRHKCTANHPDICSVLLFCQPAVTMGENSGLAAPPRFVVQVSPGRTRLCMD